MFNPSWLTDVRLRPVLQEVYDFTREHGIPPSIPVLRDIFQKKDQLTYDNRYSAVLDEVEQVDADQSEIIYMIDLAKNVAVSNSFKEMSESRAFNIMNQEYDGPGQLKAIQEWLQHFLGKPEDLEKDVEGAIKYLMDGRGWMNQETTIATGIEIVDHLTGGGLRTKQLGILMAPTGHGKSVALIQMAHKIAAVEDKNVLFISNELTMEEITERFLSRLTGATVKSIAHDPFTPEDKFIEPVKGKLKMIECLREIDSNEIEAKVARYIQLEGWKPDAVIIDFMERMKPTVSGYKRDQTWSWYGAIAQDLDRAGKRNNWLTWTAIQANRAGQHAKVQQSDFAQGSIRHLQEATAVIAMNQLDGFKKDDNDKTTLLVFKALKTRHTKRIPEPIVVEADMDRVNITNKRRVVALYESKEEEEKSDSARDEQKKKQRRKSRW
jgi:hypothetical protein